MELGAWAVMKPQQATVLISVVLCIFTHAEVVQLVFHSCMYSLGPVNNRKIARHFT